MIKIIELRTGCLLNYATSEGESLPTKIDWQDLKWLDEDPTGFNLVHTPIPLTEVWIEKLGFEKRIENAGTLVCYKLGQYTIARWIKNRWQFWINTSDLTTNPRSVHELQNLIYALTRTELENK